MDNSLLIKKHISFTSCPDIDEICRPLFLHTPVKIFEYSRVYPNGARAELSNHSDHLENAFVSRAKMSRVYTPSIVPENQRYLLVTNWIESMKATAQKTLEAQLYSQHELFNMGNELSIIQRSKEYVEYFHFYSASDDHNATNFYLNNMEIFERFCLYFLNSARGLIQKACKDPLLKAWRPTTQIEIIPDKSCVNDAHKDFLRSITPKRFFLNVDGREVYLTKKELECARHLVQGKSNRVISECMFISHRTVETHLESLRIKTNCSTRPELIEFLIQNGLSNY